MRLIDADALNIYNISPADGFMVMGVTEEDIDLAPSIDIVRCKECKFRNVTEHGKQQYEDYCRWHPWESPDDDDFCSYGEREVSDDKQFTQIWHHGACQRHQL